MKDSRAVSRRQFLQSTGAVGSAAYLRLLGPALIAITESACTAKQQSSVFKVLSEQEALDLMAIAARIIPTTDTPGATEAGVIYFFDNAFAAEMADMLKDARQGLESFNRELQGAHPGSRQFGGLGEDEQDAFLKTQESTQFFGLAWTMTMFGFFSMEQYGGNKNHIGWDLIGFEGNHGAWQYPFGHYDAEVHKETTDGE
jgi:gluconate 2-dehydrogenase gamma chain